MRLIDADALLRMICGHECGCTPEECGIEANKYDPTACSLRCYIAKMPTIEAVPLRHARWKLRVIHDQCFFQCSDCNSIFYGDTTYCPHCYAKMDGGKPDDQA